MDKNEKIKLFLKISGIGAYAKVLTEGLVGEFRGQFPPDEEPPESFKKAIVALENAVEERRSLLVDAMVKCYSDAYTEEEITRLIEFFDSHTGMKVASLGGLALNTMAEAGNAWSADTVNSIRDDLAAILDENASQLELPVELKSTPTEEHAATE